LAADPPQSPQQSPHCPQCAAALSEGARFCGDCGTLLSHNAPGAADPWLGRVVDGRYRVAALIGSGGMGVVYRVEHLHLGKLAAMKVLSPDTATKPEMVRRFRTEAQAVSKLNHPNIVQTFDFGQWDGALYLIMEYVQGDDLSSLLRRDGPWSFPRAARLFTQICSGLSEAHEAGIVHRDLKPENLMVVRRRDGSEHVKVLDFGLAKLRERAGDPQGAGVSSGGQLLGTPYYMAPEQVRGEPLDARADLYSLGATLYRVLTGEPPFDAPSPISVLTKHLTDELVPPRSRVPERGLPPEADRIVLRAMAKSAADRYPSAAEMQADLESALATASGVSASSPLVIPGARSGGPADAPTVAIDDADIAEIADVGDVGNRLRRSDVDDFEWSLRRRHLLRRLVLPIAAVVVLAAAAALGWRNLGERPDVAEHEPNNTPGYANLLAQGAPIRGTIGKRVDGAEGDVDFFRVPAGKGDRAVSARLEGIPNVDLVLELYDVQGRRVAKSDAAGRGWGEWLQPTSIGPSEVYLAVRELWIAGQAPIEDAPDPYTLTVRWGPPQPGWEVEPNDSPMTATSIGAPGRVRGYLASAEDRDWFSIGVVDAGVLTGTVAAPVGVDVVLLRDVGGKEVVINKHGAGVGEEFSLAAAPGKPILIGVARRAAARTDPKEQGPQGPQGLDDPYDLALGVSPSGSPRGPSPK
jgi:eukaryotic-like serine/threonine-protein kinase